MTITTLTSFQDDYAAESRVELVSARPPSFRDANTGIIQEAESAIVGMNLSGALVKLIDNPGGVRGLLRRWERFCRAKHRRWAKHDTDPACALMAWRVLRDHASVVEAADEIGIDYETAVQWLTNAVRQMEHWQVLEQQVDRATSHDPEFCATCRLDRAG